MSKTPLIALLTDFGSADHYVASIKGVILSALPEARFVDITHQIPPQDIRAGAFQLLSSYESFPAGTLFMCVVDPGVGSERKILYAETESRHFIAPDNGILSWVFEKEKPVRLFDVSNLKLEKEPSRTFHARDIMAPAAAKVLKGESPDKWGVPQKNWEKLSFPAVKKTGASWEGEILAVDTYGNLITNFRSEEILDLAEHSKLWFDWEGKSPAVRGLAKSYSEADPGKLLAIEGSAGFIEISVRDGNAAKETGLKVGSKINVQFRT